MTLTNGLVHTQDGYNVQQRVFVDVIASGQKLIILLETSKPVVVQGLY